MLGGEASDGLRWAELRERAAGSSADSLVRGAAAGRASCTVLSWGRADGADVPGEAMATLLDAGLRGSDLVVVDLPRHFVPRRRGSRSSWPTSTLLVVPAELRATAAAARVAGRGA